MSARAFVCVCVCECLNMLVRQKKNVPDSVCVVSKVAKFQQQILALRCSHSPVFLSTTSFVVGSDALALVCYL